MEASATLHGPWGTVKFLVNSASALLGLTGTWLMSKRYAHQPLTTVLVALSWPLLSLAGRGQQVKEFVTAMVKANRDLEDKAADMVSGLSFLFWAFLLQAVGLFLDLGQ